MTTGGCHGMRGGGLVARYNKTNAQILAQSFQRFDDHHVSAICNCVDVFHTFGMKAPHHKFSTGNLPHKFLSLSKNVD
jgi:hypothetical protein